MENIRLVLLVEDDANDVLLVRRSFKQAGVMNRLVTVSDGEQAVAFMGGKGPYADRERYPVPVLVLLDLDLPGMSGFDVLSWLKSDPDFARIPVIVLTGSVFSPDVKRAYEAGANSFLVKPVENTEFVSAIKLLTEFWLGTCELPATQPALQTGADDSLDTIWGERQAAG